MSSTPAGKEESLSPRTSTQSDLDQGINASSIPPAPELKNSIEQPEWKPSTRLYVAFLTLAVITLMVALDGTSLSVALPVS